MTQNKHDLKAALDYIQAQNGGIITHKDAILYALERAQQAEEVDVKRAIEHLNAAIDDNHTATGRLQNIHIARNLLRQGYPQQPEKGNG